MYKATFPTINLESLNAKLDDNAKQYIPFVFHIKTGELRKSKVKFTPKIKTGEKYNTSYGNVLSVWAYANKADRIKAEAGYIWRMVAFYCVNTRPYNCLPVCADFDLDGTVDEQQTTKAKLDSIIDVILNEIGHQNWHSANRWASALGYK